MHRLESLRVFLQVAKLNSFSRAAEQLEMSNATITNHIGALEQYFDMRLLNRTVRKISVKLMTVTAATSGCSPCWTI